MCLCFCSQRLRHSSCLAGQLCLHCRWCRISIYISKALDKGYFSGNCMVLNSDVPMYFAVFLPYNYEVPHNMASVLVKETRVVVLNIFGHKVWVGMQDIGMISTALVFIIQMFLCQEMDAHPELEYITLKMFLRTCFCKVSNYSFLTELQEKDKELFTLMSSSQKCHAISVGLHAWP